jgi:hypothetical protein|nr:MAG TPA: hypothetical protein [Caudoviricetes sp.]
MGRINLGRERGAASTDKPMPHSVVSDNTGLGGIFAIEKANDRLAAGMKHVSDAMFSVSKDMKNKEVRQELMNGQIEYFDRSQEALRALSEKQIYNQAEYEAAYNAAMDKVDASMSEWARKNTSWDESRDALNLTMKGERSKSYAQAMGNFLKAKNERAWNDCQNLMNRGVNSGNYDIGKAAIDTYCVGKSEDFTAKMREQYDYDFCRGRMNQAKIEIQGATSPEQISEIISRIQSNGYDLGVYEKDRLEFNVFASVHSDSLESARIAKQEKAKNAAQKTASENIDALKTDVSNAQRQVAEMGEKIGKDYFVNMRKNLSENLKSLNLSPQKQKKLLSDFDNFCRDSEKKITEEVNRNMYAQAESALKNAVEKNDGKFDLNEISGENVDAAARISEARKKVADFTERYEGLRFKYKSGNLSAEEEREYALYRGGYFKQLTSILEYDKDLDPRGEKLAQICIDIDKYDAASRKELLGALYGKVVKGAKYGSGKVPSNWDSGQLKNFDAQFAELCRWNTNENASWYLPRFLEGDDTSDPVAYMKFRNRILQLASARNLTYAETVEEMQKDPFFKRVMLTQSREKASKFLNL